MYQLHQVRTLGLEFGPASISGVSSTSAVGSVGLEFGPATITGVSATTNVGSLEIDDAELINPTGVSMRHLVLVQ